MKSFTSITFLRKDKDHFSSVKALSKRNLSRDRYQITVCKADSPEVVFGDIYASLIAAEIPFDIGQHMSGPTSEAAVTRSYRYTNGKQVVTVHRASDQPLRASQVVQAVDDGTFDELLTHLRSLTIPPMGMPNNLNT